jgi:FixJ family two-component response regulator
MGGLELQRRLNEGGARIPIVFFTALASEDEQRRAQRAGAIAVLRKPVGKEALLRVLDAVFDSSPSDRGGQHDD